MQSFWPLVNTCTYTVSVHGRVGHQNKGLDTVACCSEPGGCVSFVTALSEVETSGVLLHHGAFRTRARAAGEWRPLVGDRRSPHFSAPGSRVEREFF